MPMFLNKDFLDNDEIKGQNADQPEEIKIQNQPSQQKKQPQRSQTNRFQLKKSENDQQQPVQMRNIQKVKIYKKTIKLQASTKQSPSSANQNPSFLDDDSNQVDPNDNIVRARVTTIESKIQVARRESTMTQSIQQKPNSQSSSINVKSPQEESKDNFYKFDDEDDDQKNNIQQQSFSGNKQDTQEVQSLRPQTASTYQQRQKVLEQQKQILQEKQKMQYTSQGMQQNQSFIPNLGTNSSSYQSDIEYQKIAEILGQTVNQQYEPGQHTYFIDSSLPSLQKMNGNTNSNDIFGARPLVQTYQHQEQLVMKQRVIEEEGTKQAEQFQKLQQQQEELKQKVDDSDSDEEEDRPVVEDENVLKEQEKEEDLRKELKQQNEKVLIEQIEEKKDETQIKQDDLDSVRNQDKDSVKSSLQQKQVVKKVAYPKPLDPIVIIDMKQFLTSPSPKGGMIQCTIKRDKSGMGRFYPKYHLHLSNGFKFLMTAKKRAINNTSNYLVSMNRSDLNKKSPNFLGKVRSNFMGTEFVLYDSGDNPKKVKSIDQARCQLGMVFYESNILGTKGPRKMKFLIPRVDEEQNQSYRVRPMKKEEGLLADYRKGQTEKMIICVNRPPKWNEHVQAFVLNFYGRVDKPSVKNFQLVEENGEDIILLQFGRVGEELFNIDFQYPLSPLQAFEIALTSFDYKIACE